MNPRIAELRQHIDQIQEQIEEEIKRRRQELHADFEQRRVLFERELLDQQRRFKTGLVRYVRESELRNVITAPLIYLLLVPLLLLDISISTYQFLCFPCYRIPRVRRADYFNFDRSNLAYLNLVEKLNCAYCSYANGLAAYFREIAARTEQYWCPIKHSRRTFQAHAHYNGFADFGDAGAYAQELRHLRAKLRELDGTTPQPERSEKAAAPDL